MVTSKANAVFFSASGTTKRIIEMITGRIAKHIATYDLLNTQSSTDIIIPPNELAVVGVPVYAGRIPAICVDMLGSFKGQGTPAIAVVVYGNRDYDDALLELKELLEKNGFIVIAAAAFIAQHSIFPETGAGRPDNDDCAKITAFADKCLHKLETQGWEKAGGIAVKGNNPYLEPKAVPLHPSGDNRCTKCSTCVTVCPTGAIESRNPKKTKKERCISCAACISACPVASRKFRGPLYRVASKAFIKSTKERKEPEIFI